MEEKGPVPHAYAAVHREWLFGSANEEAVQLTWVNILHILSFPWSFLGSPEAEGQDDQGFCSGANGRNQSLVHSLSLFGARKFREARFIAQAFRTQNMVTLQGLGLSRGQSLMSSVPEVKGVLRRQEVAESLQVWENVAAAPAQHTAGSGAHVQYSFPWLPHSAEDTPQRPQKAQHRPGGSGG